METYLATKKKKKKKIHYTMLLVSDSATKDIKKYSFSPKVWKAFIYIIGIILLAGVAAGIYTGMLVSDDGETVQLLQTQVEELTTKNTELQVLNEELSSKVGILSDTINEKVEVEAAQAAELEEKHLPKGFPLSGTATMEEQQAPETPIIVFVANQGINVIASGSGVVELVGDDGEYGHIVKINHGNGYLSSYRCSSDVQVSQGAEVERGTVLFQMNSNDQKLGYQIQLNDVYIEPMDLLEVYG